MKKRILLVILALALFVTAFAGCDKGGDSKKYDYSISLGIWPSDTQTQDVRMFQEFTTRFNEKYPNVEVKPAHYEYKTDSFIAEIESKSIPTIFDTWYTEPQKLIAGNFVKDITKEYSEKGWEMNPTLQGILSKDDKLYGLPRDGYVLGIHCNIGLFKDAGLTNEDGTVKYPKTWDELAVTASKIKKETGKAGITILALDKNGGWHFVQIAWCFGAKFETQDENGKWISHLNSKESVEAMKYVSDLKWKYDAINDDPLSCGWQKGWENIATDTSAMCIGAQDGVDQYGTSKGMDPTNLAIVPMPSGPAGQFALHGGTPYMFPRYATEEQVKSVFNFLEIWGKVPGTDEQTIKGIKQGYETKLTKGIPNIPTFNAWVNEDYIKLIDDIRKDYENVDMKNFQDYYDMVNKEGVLRLEEPQETQDMYNELNKVLQIVLTDDKADIQKLLDEANDNFQTILDQKVNNKDQ